MTCAHSRRALLIGALAALGTPLPIWAAPRPYGVVPGTSDIRFTFDLNGVRQMGTTPLARADLRIDTSDLAASTADVTADLRRVRTGLIFATDALKSAAVLDVGRHPIARFRSTRVRLGPGGRLSGGASLDGQLTLRGVTRPIRFDAALFRPPGTAPEDLDRLSVRLSGALRRSAFGATGFADLAADRVGLEIRAEIAVKG